jgi:hypothetical protein
MNHDINILSSLLSRSANQQNFNILWKKTGYWWKLTIAENEDTPANILEFMATDEDIFVRKYIAGNQSTPPKILTILANDERELVRASVAKNPQTPLYILELLSNDEAAFVRSYLKRNKNWL